MKKILSLVLVSVLGGAITLGTYKTFLEEKQDVVTTQQQTAPVFIPTNNTVSNTNLTAMENISFVTAAEKTVNAVVHVKNVTIGSKQITLQDLFMGRTQQRRQLGTGSGVIISPDGYIITNNHVIEGSEALSVTLNNNKTFKAEIVGTDPKTDIALLKIEADEDLPYTTFGDSDNAKIGEWVLAVGNPFNLTSTVTAGIISAKSRDLSGNSSQSFIQTDAAVNPGNSGGALVNANGELIGINTAITSQTGSYVGYSFAVPSNIARKVIQDIMEYGNVQNGILGISGNSLSSGFAEKFGLSETEGVYVDDVEEDTGAFDAGLQSGDIIKKIDGIKIRKFTDLKGFINSKRPNDVVTVSFLRDGKEKEAKVTLLKNNSITVPIIGVLKDAKPKDLKKYNVNNGVKISKLSGPYSQYFMQEGIEEGNIITAINNVKINSIDEVQEIIKNRDPYRPLSIEILNSKGEKNKYGLK
ncbi:trypsin-like peptidase domain-containing protein [Pontimicrobium sp. MEBiC01747]